MILTIIGVGLIGGSMAMDLKRSGMVNKVIGVDHNPENIRKAIELGFVDEGRELDDALGDSDVILLAIPVDAARKIIIDVLDKIPDSAIVIDLGSSKAGICEITASHPNRKQYVACHPIAGTEFSGPTAAHNGLFNGKVNIICNREESSESAVSITLKLSEAVGMQTIFMTATEHDRHIAYVSHLSHVTSFTLGLTVLDIEKNEKNIFNMAGSGFASTVRLAKSSPDMWAPIFEQNSNNLVEAMDAYIEKLQTFRNAIKTKDKSLTHKLIQEGNEIRRILDGIELKNKEKNGTNG